MEVLTVITRGGWGVLFHYLFKGRKTWQPTTIVSHLSQKMMQELQSKVSEMLSAFLCDHKSASWYTFFFTERQDRLLQYHEDQPDKSPLFSLQGTTGERSFGDKLIARSCKCMSSLGQLPPCPIGRRSVSWPWLWKRRQKSWRRMQKMSLNLTINMLTSNGNNMLILQINYIRFYLICGLVW